MCRIFIQFLESTELLQFLGYSGPVAVRGLGNRLRHPALLGRDDGCSSCWWCYFQHAFGLA